MAGNSLKTVNKSKDRSGKFFDITGQTHSSFIYVIDKDVEIRLQIPDRLLGANFIAFAVYAKTSGDKSDKIWVNDRTIQNVLIAGESLQWDDKFKRFKPRMLRLDKPVDIGIEATVDELYDQKMARLDTFRQQVLNNYERFKAQFPDLTTARASDAPEFGSMTADDYNKVNEFFDDGEVYAWQWADQKKSGANDPGKWVTVKQGKKKMEAYAKVIGNLRVYDIHMMYMDYLDKCTAQHIIDIAKDVEPGLVKGSIIDPRPNTKDGITDDKIRKVMNTWLQAVKDISPVMGLAIEDVRIWLYYSFYLKKGVFKGLSVNKTFAEKAHLSVKNMSKNKDHDFFYNINAWDGWITFLVGALANSQYNLEETELFKLSTVWDDQATRLKSKFI